MSELPFLCTVIILAYSSQTMFLPLVPLYSAELGYTAADVGIVFAANLVAASTLSIPFGSLSDRLGRKNTITLGLAITTAGSATFLFADNLLLMILAYTLAGVGHAAYGTGTAAYPADIGAAGGALERAVGWSQSSRQLAFIAGPVLGTFIKAASGYRVAFLSATLIMGVASGVAFSLLPNIGLKRAQGLAGDSRGSAGRGRILTGIILIMIIVIICQNFSTGTFHSFISLFASQKGFPIYTIGLIFSAQALASGVTRPVLTELIRRTGRRKSILVVSAMAGSAIMATVTSLDSIPLVIGSSVVLGLSQAGVMTMAAVTLATVAPEGRRGVVLAFFNTSLYAGLGVGPAVIGQLVDRYGFDLGFKAAAAVTLLGAIIFAIGTRGRSLAK